MQVHRKLVSSQHNTPLGTMTIIADEATVYLLQFTDNEDLPHKIAGLLSRATATVEPGSTPAINALAYELDLYFEGKLRTFTTPVAHLGTPFSVRVWQALQNIPYQQTCSYRCLATTVGNPRAYRAVARANAVNPLAIVVPCHRAINTNGNLGGYNGGIERKAWLIDHEKVNSF